MEAAGVADSTWDFGVSYLVIRGICDYCDVNKADTWQEYAAVAAAGYTCALLQSLPAIPAHRNGSTLPISGAATSPLHRSSSAVAPFPKVWNVPYRFHPLFADNKELLRVIHERFIEGAERPSASSRRDGEAHRLTFYDVSAIM
jgi:hypothetical protein